jgi:putative membrane protein
MKRILSVICCMAVCSIPALAQGKHMRTAAMSDQQFVNFAAQTDMVEANLGQLAQTVSTSQQVKDYAQMLVSDHTNDFHQLYEAAHRSDLDVPDAIDADHNKTMIGPFQKLKGSAFDRRYIHEMVAGHTKAIDVYRKEAIDAQNTAIKAYAADALPVLQKHLDEAKALAKNKIR